ncbi:hypothetical protein [Aureliella helgolandensis]|nr:hypothetical protein [Aureliella helgolandensis]
MDLNLGGIRCYFVAVESGLIEIDASSAEEYDPPAAPVESGVYE